jgi:hypothetical protein
MASNGSSRAGTPPVQSDTDPRPITPVGRLDESFDGIEQPHVVYVLAEAMSIVTPQSTHWVDGDVISHTQCGASCRSSSYDAGGTRRAGVPMREDGTVSRASPLTFRCRFIAMKAR